VSLLLRRGTQSYRLARPFGEPEVGARIVPSFELRSLLASLAARGEAMRALRRWLSTELGAQLSRLEDHDVLARFAHELEAGRVRVTARADQKGTWARADAAHVEVPALGPEDALGTTWIEVVLLDDQGRPVADEPYRIARPDGSTFRKGKLDGKGRVRITGLPEDAYRVFFDDRDPLWWKREEAMLPRRAPPAAGGPLDLPPSRWVDIVLTDDDGRPMAGERFRVERESGEVVSRGELDDDGIAHVAVPDDDAYRIVFPDRDPAWWREAESASPS
jgi:hypothetical protein